MHDDFFPAGLEPYLSASDGLEFDESLSEASPVNTTGARGARGLPGP